MITTGEVVQIEYTWKHPQRGEVVVRCVGAMSGNQNGEISLEGYHRVIDDMEQTQYLSRNYENEIFEFHEVRSMIYFHSARNLIFGGRKEGRRISGVNNLSFQYQKREGSSVLWRELVVHLFQEVCPDLSEKYTYREKIGAGK